MPITTYQSFLGIAKEATKLTPVAATDYIPCKTMTPVDHQTYLAVGGIRGSQVASYGQIPSVTWAEYGFDGDVYPDTIGYPLAGVLGDVVTTGTAAPYSHVMAVKNTGDGQPGSFTLTDYNAISTRQFAGAQFSEVGFTFAANGLLTYTAKASAAASVTTTMPTRSYSAITPIAAWRGVITIGGTTDLHVLDGTCDIKRTVDVIDTIDGAANPYALFAGPVSVTGKLSVVAETEATLTNYLNNVQPSLDIAFSQGAGVTLNSVTLHMTSAAYITGAINRGKDYIGFDITYDAVANTTDVGATGGYSPIKATVASAKPAGTYA